MFARLGVSEEIVHSFVDAYKRHYRIIATEKTTLLPNAKEAVVKASEFARVGVVTTKTRAYSMEILEHLGIGKYFETVVGRECVQNPKPHPEPVLVALERMKLKKDGVFLIGDTMLDLLASKDASIEFVGVCGKYEDMDIFKKECKVLKKDALDAVYYIKKRKI
jgi:phosphoglycolate phosphatase